MGRILKLGPSGSGVDGDIDPMRLHEKDRKIYEKMSFLKDFIKPRETRSTCDVSIQIIVTALQNITYLFSLTFLTVLIIIL